MISPETVVQIEAALAEANGRRRERLLSLNQVLTRVHSALGGKIEWAHGGTVSNNYGSPASTTLVLAAWVDDKVFVGVTVAPAIKTSPGRAWKCLQPWSTVYLGTEGTPGALRFRERLRSWTRQPGVIEVGITESLK